MGTARSATCGCCFALIACMCGEATLSVFYSITIRSYVVCYGCKLVFVRRFRSHVGA